jgi:hypothetical protein
MINTNELEMKKFVSSASNLFEDVAESHENAKDVFKTEYSILNYGEILDKMAEFVDGYCNYAKGDNKKFDGKVTALSKTFYDNMFKDKKKYRTTINLKDFRSISTSFLQKTKKLQAVMDKCIKENTSAEANAFIRLTNNQYAKLSRVFKEDMNIYLWLSSTNSKSFAHKLDNTTREKFNSKNTPNMHVYRKGDELI